MIFKVSPDSMSFDLLEIQKLKVSNDLNINLFSYSNIGTVQHLIIFSISI